MENVNCVPRTPQQLVDENIKFLENIRPEDVEYSDSTMSIILGSPKGTAEDILDQLKHTDLSEYFFDSFPRDRSTVLIGKEYFQWQIQYYDKNGKQYKYVEDILTNDILDRVVHIISPKDAKELADS